MAGHIESIVDAIGESDNEIGGLNQTRLTSVAAEATALGPPYTWDGTDTVLSPDTSDVVVGDYIRLDEDGQPFEITAITPNVDVTVDAGSQTIPTGPVATALVKPFTWNGTTVITQAGADTSEVGIGVWIRLDADGQWFEVVSVGVADIQIANPLGLTIPSGGTPSSKTSNAVTSKVTNSIAVETTLDWPDSGKISVEGVSYTYGSKTLNPPSFDELSYVTGGASRVGLKRDHIEQATVTDISLEVSAIEQVRRAMLVNFAEGADLNALGRNLGVLRFPFLESDDLFREIVKALAYNPKGTVFGLELALNAMVGEGNYNIVEDLINYPNTVFIDLLAGPFLGDSFEGKAYLTGPESRLPLSDTTVDIDKTVVAKGTVHSVTWKNEDHLSDFRAQKPSADSIIDYDGDLGTTIWAYTGASEAADVTVLPNDEGVEIKSQVTTNSIYRHLSRVIPESYVAVTCVTYIDSLSNIQPGVGSSNQWAMWIGDGAHRISWGCYGIGGGQYNLVLTSGATQLGAAAVLNFDTYYNVELRKYGTNLAELWVDGALIERQPYSAFTALAPVHEIRFGVISSLVPGVIRGRYRQIGYYVRSVEDYWGSRDDAGATAVANDRQLDTGIPAFFVNPDDLGKRLVIRNSGATNAQGGNSNGIYEIDSIIGGDKVNLRGPAQTNGTVQSSLPLRFVADDDGQQFQFPDDLGKTLVISGSSQGNDGFYVVDKLLDADTLVDLESWATPVPQKTTVCEVVGATFTSEGGIAWRLDPDFEDEPNVEWEMSDTGSISGSTITMRQSLPLAGGYPRVLNVVYSQVLSAQVLLSITVKNELTQELPSLAFLYYPFYISNPLGFIQAFLDDITAAGVIPEFLED